jgi:3-dehydro-L-gulonate 2-dehydrogenase
MIRVPIQEVQEVLREILEKHGMSRDRASLCARLFAESSRDGVHSHGLGRFPRFVRGIRNGLVNVHSAPELVAARGALERWSGRRGVGNLNAWQSMERAIALAQTHGLGCVALAHTNHWMRGGAYGWQAAEAGVIGICWTNTMPNLPPWGSSAPLLGNNPLVIAVPRSQGHVVLDMAMSQFSYGALESYRKRGQLLPVDGGFDSQGRLTRDPGAIEASGRPLPIGYWKGSGLALMLDLLAGLLSGGQVTHEISADPERETDLSQVFIAISLDLSSTGDNAGANLADQVVSHLQSSLPQGEQCRYPGQNVLKTRNESLAKGIAVEPALWEEIKVIRQSV